MGLEDHPFAHGYLCVRGLRYTAVAYSEDRLTTPLKNDGQGNFSAVSWDEAIVDIAVRINEAEPSAWRCSRILERPTSITPSAS